MRRVVLLCGPPGAGKTTAAHASGMEVFDRDDARWSSEREFRAALAALAARRHVEAVVIRSTPTSTARAAAAALIGATDTFLVVVGRDELRDRVRARGRSVAESIAGIDRWLSSFDADDDVRAFPGWPAVHAPDLGLTTQAW